MNASQLSEKDKLISVASLIENIYSSDGSNFYRSRWGTKTEFSELPFIEDEDFLQTPFSKRRYFHERGLVKVIRKPDGPYLIQRCIADIREENYGSSCRRPIVLLADGSDALEKVLWFYEHDTLPLLGRSRNMAVAAYCAAWYKADALVSDVEMLSRFFPHLEKVYDPRRIRALTLIERAFPSSIQKWRALFPAVRIIIGLPECGVFAEQCPGSGVEPIFHADKNSILEVHEGCAVVTKLLPLVTPVIRYKTELFAAKGPSACPCGKEAFIL